MSNNLKLHRGQMIVYKSRHRFKCVVAGRRFGKCLTSGTSISMADGSEKPIESVIAGDIVLTINEDTYQLENKIVQHVHDNGIKETVSVKTSKRSLRCTPNHPILANNTWINAGDLKIGDLLAVPKYLNFGTTEMPARININEYLPIAYDDFVKHLVYAKKDVTKYGGFNCAISRDLPDLLREHLNVWRKQTRSRISRYRFELLREFTDGYFDSIADGDLSWEEVKAIDTEESEQTWDLTVEDNHNFVANGVITHNTILSKTMIIKYATKPKSKVWYVAPTYRMAKQIMWQDLQDSLPRRWIKKVNDTTLTIWLVNGSIIELKGADNPDALRGVGLDFLVLDEFQDMGEDTWKKVLRPTLADRKGHALFIGSPKGFNYFYEIYMLGQDEDRDKKGQWKSWQFPTIMSPFIPREEIEAARRDMDEKSFNQEFLADFTNMTGRVYHSFDARVHVKSCPFNKDLPIWVGQDFNIDPMSAVIMQPQPDGSVWIVDEIVKFSSNTEESVNEIERRYYRYRSKVYIFPDPAGNSRQHARGETDLDIFREKGFNFIKFRKKHPPVADRVNCVNRMLRAADGTTRLFVDEKCKSTIESFNQTTYKKGTKEIDKGMNIEHATDALGYCIEMQFPLGKIEILGVSL